MGTLRLMLVLLAFTVNIELTICNVSDSVDVNTFLTREELLAELNKKESENEQLKNQLSKSKEIIQSYDSTDVQNEIAVFFNDTGQLNLNVTNGGLPIEGLDEGVEKAKEDFFSAGKEAEVAYHDVRSEANHTYHEYKNKINNAFNATASDIGGAVKDTRMWLRKNLPVIVAILLVLMVLVVLCCLCLACICPSLCCCGCCAPVGKCVKNLLCCCCRDEKAEVKGGTGACKGCRGYVLV